MLSLIHIWDFDIGGIVLPHGRIFVPPRAEYVADVYEVIRQFIQQDAEDEA